MDTEITNNSKILLVEDDPQDVKMTLAALKESRLADEVIHERKYWKHYMEAYEDCLNATSTHHAPWFVVPADDKDDARLIVSRIILDGLNELKMAYPKTTAKRRQELKSIRKLLAN